MASIFTYQEEPHRVHSPWSTPGDNTPQSTGNGDTYGFPRNGKSLAGQRSQVTKLEPEKHDGPVEYKLHILLRWRRTFSYTSTSRASANHADYRIGNSAVLPANLVPFSLTKTTQPSTQSRQARLQQLTTQLLWRLQQSSPFHSSSNRDLVLPLLPEAMPRLGVPDHPSTLLPGLEESQGALYEIGVADDGTLVGLADDELEESLNNLRAMAASLGCLVDVHRRIVVGDCTWNERAADGHQICCESKLWAAEVLVRPQSKTVEVNGDSAGIQKQMSIEANGDGEHALFGIEAAQQHFRVALVGSSGAGKSSLLGTLTASVLDDRRGKSRLSLLKHRHEITSGVTSSVAHEFLGYQTMPNVHAPLINYASGDVSSWPDIHNLADRVLLLSDSPGQPKYAKSTFRALIGWNPTWTVLCIAADDQMHSAQEANSQNGSNLARAYLRLCLELSKPLVVIVTKLDVAQRAGIRHVLSTILAEIRSAGRSPLMLNGIGQTNRSGDTTFGTWINEGVLQAQGDIDAKLTSIESSDISRSVPILMTSAVSGYGLAELHATLRSLPIPASQIMYRKEVERATPDMVFRIDEVFAIPPSKVYSGPFQERLGDQGVVLCGVLDSGIIELGQVLQLGPFSVQAEAVSDEETIQLRQASSLQAGSGVSSLPPLRGSMSKSLQPRGFDAKQKYDTSIAHVHVRVVSLRNLRLPVSRLCVGSTGTVGIQCLEGSVDLSRARKGMVLLPLTAEPVASTSFSARFIRSKFDASDAPNLILGGYATAYIHSIRAQVKVSAIDVDDADATTSDSSGRGLDELERDMGLFAFDDASETRLDDSLCITFKFVRNAEYIRDGDQVLIVPSLVAAGPITGLTTTAAIAGLSGFVGTVTRQA